jgi:hypothetical protein
MNCGTVHAALTPAGESRQFCLEEQFMVNG